MHKRSDALEPLPRVLIVGGGVAGLEAALALHDLAPRLADVTLVAPDPDFMYKPMVVEEPFTLSPAERVELAPALRGLGTTYLDGAVVAVDPARHEIELGDGRRVGYEKLIVGIGGRAKPMYSDAETFWAHRSDLPIDDMLEAAAIHSSRTLAFIVPPSSTWPLPLYELALLARRRADEKGLYGVGLQVITPELSPLRIFGQPATDALTALLRARGIDVLTGTYATESEDGRIILAPGIGALGAASAVALPTIRGPRLPGLPADDHGFIPTDEHARVEGVDDVYAAGDGTTFPIKQGGLATQQADAAAEHIAAALGANVDPQPFHPVLRGQLLTGEDSLDLRHDVTGGHGEGTASLDRLWWPSHKVAGRYLAPWLAHTSPTVDMEPPVHSIEVEVALPHEWHWEPMTTGLPGP